MSVMTRTATVPEWDMADRLHKSLRASGVGVQEMADELGVGRNTVSYWLSGRREPKRLVLVVWAMKTGVPLEWLETGSADDTHGYRPAVAERQSDVTSPYRAQFGLAA